MQWLTSTQTGARIQRDPSSVRRAAECGLLHGHQRLDQRGRPLARSRWSFHPDAVDVWVQGGDEAAQRRACGCAALRSVTGRKAG